MSTVDLLVVAGVISLSERPEGNPINGDIYKVDTSDMNLKPDLTGEQPVVGAFWTPEDVPASRLTLIQRGDA